MSDDESRPNKKARKPDPDDESAGSDDGSDDGEEIIGPNGKKTKGKGGSSCHQCKSRRNFGALTYCTSNLDEKKKKRCRKKFCGHCLKKFYKENVDAIVDKNNWACPSCRKICCCAACRRRKNKEGSKAGAGSDLSPPPSKPKKSSSHKDHHRDRDRHSGGAGHGGYSRHGRDDGSDVLHYGPGGVATNDEGYPIQSSRRGDRERGLHGSSHSPRMMSDSPSMRGTTANLPRPYDLDERDDRKRGSRGHGGRGGAASGGKNAAAAAASSEYDDSDGDAHNSYSSSGEDDSRSSSDADDGAGQSSSAARHQRDRRGGGGGGGGVSSSVPLAEFASDAHDDGDAPSLPSSHFTSALSSHIKLLAEESSRNAQSPFARLYKSAQQSKIKKKIKAILVRPDLKKEKKVEMIAALLTPLEDAGIAAPSQQQQQQTNNNSPMASSSSAAAAAASSSSHGPSPMATA